MTRLK